MIWHIQKTVPKNAKLKEKLTGEYESMCNYIFCHLGVFISRKFYKLLQ